MPQPEHFDVLVLGSGQGGQLIAWHLARAGRRAALVERRWVGGACPNIACMPSKTELWSARLAHLARHGQPFGVTTGGVTTGGVTIHMPAIAYFPGSVSGLAPGSEVTMHGLRVGQVTDVRLTYDTAKDAVVAPVRFEVEPERIIGIGKRVF